MSTPEISLGEDGKPLVAQPTAAVLETVSLSESERKFVYNDMVRRGARGARRPPALVGTKGPDGTSAARPDPKMDADLFWAQLAAATGSPHEEAQRQFLTELYAVFVGANGSTANNVSEALAHMLDIGPRDGLEGMLAVQMVSVHHAAMRLLGGAVQRGQPLEAGAYRFNNALRLMRLFAVQLDTLNRHRGKAPSEQKVTVEHVHVHEGGQAVVGNVTAAPQRPHHP